MARERRGNALFDMVNEKLQDIFDPAGADERETERQYNIATKKEKLAEMKDKAAAEYRYNVLSKLPEDQRAKYDFTKDEAYQKRFGTPQQPKVEDSFGSNVAGFLGGIAGSALTGNPLVGSVLGNLAGKRAYQGVTGEQSEPFNIPGVLGGALGSQIMGRSGANIIGAKNPTIGTAVDAATGQVMGTEAGKASGKYLAQGLATLSQGQPDPNADPNGSPAEVSSVVQGTDANQQQAAQGVVQQEQDKPGVEVSAIGKPPVVNVAPITNPITGQPQANPDVPEVSQKVAAGQPTGYAALAENSKGTPNRGQIMKGSQEIENLRNLSKNTEDQIRTMRIAGMPASEIDKVEKTYADIQEKISKAESRQAKQEAQYFGVIHSSVLDIAQRIAASDMEGAEGSFARAKKAEREEIAQELLQNNGTAGMTQEQIDKTVDQVLAERPNHLKLPEKLESAEDLAQVRQLLNYSASAKYVLQEQRQLATTEQQMRRYDLDTQKFMFDKTKYRNQQAMRREGVNIRNVKEVMTWQHNNIKTLQTSQTNSLREIQAYEKLINNPVSQATAMHGMDDNQREAYRASQTNKLEEMKKQHAKLSKQVELAQRDYEEDAKSLRVKVGVPSSKPTTPTSKFVEGKIYTDAKGNKAKYSGGKWVPVK